MQIPTLGESYRRATTQKPIRDRGLTQVLPGWHDCLHNATVERDAQMPWGGHPLCGKPADYLPPGTVGQWPPATFTMADRVRGGVPITVKKERLGPWAGIPKRKLPNCQSHKRYSRNSVGCIHTL